MFCDALKLRTKNVFMHIISLRILDTVNSAYEMMIFLCSDDIFVIGNEPNETYLKLINFEQLKRIVNEIDCEEKIMFKLSYKKKMSCRDL